MLTMIKNKLITLLQLVLVMVYIIFEELIWEGIAKPIYEHVHALKILQKIEKKLRDVNPSIILFIFMVLLITVELAGLYAGVLFLNGHVFLGLILYLSKIPIAAFTFWLFRVTEDKLMRFNWFRRLYELIMKVIAWLKSSKIYKETMKRLKAYKKEIKIWKEKHFSKNSAFFLKVKKLYKNVKASLKNKDDE